MTKRHQKECDRVRDAIELWLDGELEPGEAERFRNHLSQCHGCEAEVERARAVLEELRALPTRECPDEVVERAVAAARGAGSPLRERIAQWLGPRVEVFLRPAMVAMVLIVVAAGVFVIANRGRVGGPESRYTQSEVEEAAREARLAFAYVGYYSRRTGRILSNDVMAKRVVPQVADAVTESGREVIDRALVPSVEEAVLHALFVETIPRMNPSRE